MTFELGLSKSIARFAAIAFVALSASACSSAPSWVDPTNWMGGDDQAASASDDQSNAKAPDLASIPDKPAAPSTVDERKQVADTLKADRADAQYSGDALRGGTEPSAAPPSNAPAVEEMVNNTSSNASPSAATPAATASVDQPAATSVSTPDTATAQSSTAPTSSQMQTAVAAPAVQAPATQVASVGHAADSVPATAPVASMPTPSMSDDQLGFQQSKAPPLDPSVAHFVPRSVLDQIQHNSTDTSAVTAPTLTAPSQSKPSMGQTSSAIDPPTDRHVIQASYVPSDASVTPPVSRPVRTAVATPASYTSNQHSGASAVVFFSHDAAVLNLKSKAEVLAAAQSFRAGPGTGFVKIVGHSSSRTGDMPMARHLEVVFSHSQDFATAVAHELIRDGVPAEKVLIEAVGDSQPVYYESMPQGEAGNRRAEIFL